jgi:hypothetical protein
MTERHGVVDGRGAWLCGSILDPTHDARLVAALAPAP